MTSRGWCGADLEALVMDVRQVEFCWMIEMRDA